MKRMNFRFGHLPKMRRLGRFLPTKKEKDQETGDDRQDAADEDQPVWHVWLRSRPYSTLNQHVGLVCDRCHLAGGSTGVEGAEDQAGEFYAGVNDREDARGVGDGLARGGGWPR